MKAPRHSRGATQSTTPGPRDPRIPLWVDLRGVPVNKRLSYFQAIAAAGSEHTVLAKGDPHLERPELHPLAVDGKGLVRDGAEVVARFATVADKRTQERAMQAQGRIIVEATDWRVIPLENLVAARRDRPGTLFAAAANPREARLFAQALETGVHGIVLRPDSPADIQAADEQLRLVHRIHDVAPAAVDEVTHRPRDPVVAGPLRKAPALPDGTIAGSAANTATNATSPAIPVPVPAQNGAQAAPSAAPAAAPAAALANLAGEAQLALVEATILSIEDAGMGDRVCVDCTSLFAPGEGMLVGSTATSLALVHAETTPNGLVPTRPFRVNAGAVHSYVLAPQGLTRYLAELAAGDAALAVDAQGRSRVLRIGRCKVEPRPHSLVKWRTAQGEGMAVLQTAETVALVAPGGRPIPVTALKSGDRILVRNETAARHVGMPVDGRLTER